MEPRGWSIGNWWFSWQRKVAPDDPLVRFLVEAGTKP
jgi:hypothetical protein